MWILPLQKTCNFICILNSNCHQVKPWSQQRSAKARDPQVLCSWGPPPSSFCTASDATFTRSFTTSTWPFQAARCNGVSPRAAHAAETFLAECGGKSHNRNRDRTKFTRRSQCQETGDLLRQGREKFTGFQGWFAWKVSWKDSNCQFFCSYLN